jgi:hypothetical protein
LPVATFPGIYRIVLKGVVLGQETVNVFYYGDTNVAISLNGIAIAFRDDVATPISGIMNQNASFTSIGVEQVRGGNGFTQIGISVQGTNGGDCLPPYASWDFTLVRAGVGERNGYKRIAGVGEGNQTNGVANTGIVTALDTAAAAMLSLLVVGDDGLTPVIRRTRVNKFPQNPPIYYTMSDVNYSKIGTQNSRKYGHGS